MSLDEREKRLQIYALNELNEINRETLKRLDLVFREKNTFSLRFSSREKKKNLFSSCDFLFSFKRRECQFYQRLGSNIFL